jgi:hypothetical protein
MATVSYRQQLLRTYLLSCSIRDFLRDPDDPLFASLDNRFAELNLDFEIMLAIIQTRYLRGRGAPVPKAGNFHLAWEYAQSPEHHHRFVNMLRMSPESFQLLHTLIQDHPVFTNGSNNAQTPVENQLAVTLFRMGRYGNGASVMDIARQAGCSEGAVEAYTSRCFEAIESLQAMFMRPMSEQEKEVEKAWIEEHVGLGGLWREGWVMYDGTIVVLYQRPGLNGDAYYTRKGNYGLNCQVCLV